MRKRLPSLSEYQRSKNTIVLRHIQILVMPSFFVRRSVGYWSRLPCFQLTQVSVMLEFGSLLPSAVAIPVRSQPCAVDWRWRYPRKRLFSQGSLHAIVYPGRKAHRFPMSFYRHFKNFLFWYVQVEYRLRA